MQITLATGWLCLALSLVAACAAPLEAPTAYRDERYLCGPEHTTAFQAWAGQCTEDYLIDRSCLGVLSMKGETDGDPFVVDSTLVTSYEPDDSPMGFGSINASGSSPYFEFDLTMTNVHREPVAESGVSCRSGTSFLGIEVRGASNNLIMNIEKCEIEPRLSGTYLALSARFVRGGFVDACMYLLP